MNIERVAVVGAGRVGLSLARALVHSGCAVTVLGRRPRALAVLPGSVIVEWDSAIGAADLVMVAVPDDALAAVARTLAHGAVINARHVLLHTSGLHDRSAFTPLYATGAALGSWHPLQTFANPLGEPKAFADAPAVIEGDARALSAGRELADLLHLRPVIEIAADGKPLYHAGAVFASNYLIVLADVAAKLAREAGAGTAAAQLYLPLMRRTLANYARGGAAMLTGPISRGDPETIARHLEALESGERALYIALGREALRLAVDAGLEARTARTIEALFENY